MAEKLTCAIIEDDPVSMSVIQGLAEKTGLFQSISCLDSSSKAVGWLINNPVDLIFLDVEMPDLTGLELLKSLTNKPAIIIISSNPKYAVDAFEYSVTDFLLKPVKDYVRFLTAVNKVKFKDKAEDKRAEEELFVKVDSLLMKLNFDDIVWVEASGDYIKIQTVDKVQVVYSTLKKMEEKLPLHKFVRVHRSFLVNISKITNIDSSNLEINKKIIPISGTYKEDLLKRISVL
ncbi:MAG: response regulator transcription factor [Cyclobacteriaceae bacterium]|nr:response regulator transcription factor [Cyclobacteriaceae bacterium]